jgi:hypothetical protein
MFVRFSTSFRGRLPFRIRDIFCQSTCLSHLYSKVTKVPKYSMRVRNLPDHLCPGYEWWKRVAFRLFLFSRNCIGLAACESLFAFNFTSDQFVPRYCFKCFLLYLVFVTPVSGLILFTPADQAIRLKKLVKTSMLTLNPSSL